MTLSTQVAAIAFLVLAAVGERNDLVRYSGFPDEVPGFAISAERLSLIAVLFRF